MKIQPAGLFTLRAGIEMRAILSEMFPETVKGGNLKGCYQPNGGGNSPLCGIGLFHNFLITGALPLSPEINAHPLNRSGKFSQKHRRPTTPPPSNDQMAVENAKCCN